MPDAYVPPDLQPDMAQDVAPDQAPPDEGIPDVRNDSMPPLNAIYVSQTGADKVWMHRLDGHHE